MNKLTIAITLLLATFVACKKKEVKVPKIALNGIEEVQNNSIIWMFNDNGKLDLNEANRISSTHWLFNIDKNLQLKDILPEVIRLRTKHNDKSPHNTKRMHNYFSYANSLNDKLTFYRFDTIVYQFVKKENLPIYKQESDTALIIDIKKKDITKLKGKKVMQFAYSNKVNFQEYLMSKTLIFSDSLKISNMEFVVY